MVSKKEETKDPAKPNKNMISEISDEDLKSLAAFCFDTLIAQLDKDIKKGPKYSL